ncbi:MAG: hypothetical protein OEZ22_03855 [Spirochaetia bacterium]|nr:hypothetical protein [Spirochaetia bacterium]
MKNRKYHLIILFSIFLALFYFSNKKPEYQNQKINLTVGVFQDNRLEKLSNEDIDVIFNEAIVMLQKKFTNVSVNFSIIKTGTLENLFNESAQKNSKFDNWLKNFEPLLGIDEKKWEQKILLKKNEIINFLKNNWSLSDLNTYYKAKSYSDFADYLIKVYNEKLLFLKKYKLKNQNSLFSKNHKYHSYKAWVELMKYQDSYDIILTNTILVYDEIEKPYPHVIFKHAKVSGSSFESPAREGNLAGVSSFSSVFELYSNEPYFLGKASSKMGSLSRDFINKAIGGYLVAHEMGHQIYWIPDVYDHPKGCLMDTKFENLEIADGYKQLLEENPKCKKCEKYIKARDEIFTGQKLLKDNKKDKAAFHIKKGLKLLPEKLDRDYKEVESYFLNLIK